MTEISAMYEALDNMDDYALMANVKPIGPHKVLTDAIAELEQLRQRVQELERFHELDTKQIAYLFEERDALKQQRDDLMAAAEAIEINAEECLDFDECTAMLVQIDDYHKLMEAIASVKEK